MYKKVILGNNNKEHLFSPPLSFAPPLPWRTFFLLVRPPCRYAAPLMNGKFISQGRKYNLCYILSGRSLLAILQEG